MEQLLLGFCIWNNVTADTYLTFDSLSNVIAFYPFGSGMPLPGGLLLLENC